MRFRLCGLAATAVVLLGTSQLLAQFPASKTFTFDDGTDDGWSTAFGTADAGWTVANVGGSNRMLIPRSGFQDAGYASGNAVDPFFQAMVGAAQVPALYNISYDYYIDTSTFGANAGTFLQLGVYVNTGGGYYAQDFSTPNEVAFSQAQLTSGGILSGHVSVNVAAVGFAMPADTFYRLGLIENGNGSAQAVYYDNISVSPVPEPCTLVLGALGGLSLLVCHHRRKN